VIWEVQSLALRQNWGPFLIAGIAILLYYRNSRLCGI